VDANAANSTVANASGPIALASVLIHIAAREVFPWLNRKWNGKAASSSKAGDSDRKLLEAINKLQESDAAMMKEFKSLTDRMQDWTDKTKDLDTEIKLLKQELVGIDGRSGLLDNMRSQWQAIDELRTRQNELIGRIPPRRGAS
jgi:predicted  nucleic acid-binding Zn-ribbon protein